MTLPTLRSLSIAYGKSDLVAVSVTAAVVSAWAGVAGAGFSVRALLACQAIFFCYYLAGTLLASVRALTTGILFDLPLRLLVGYGLVNTTLFVLAWLSPLGIALNFAIVFAIVVALFFRAGERKSVRTDSAGVWVIALCLVAATLWCRDSIQPRIEQGEVVSFKPWVDGFYHAVHVRIFADSHGATSIEDFRLAGIPARPYHYGMYLLPALIERASGIDAYTAFAGVLAPVGVLFTGFAAYAFCGSIWGAWPGFAAAAALLLLPDGAQQGMHNPFMSYHWLTQISPSASYGLALLAVAWLFVIKGCVRGSRLQLATGWSLAAVVLIYKVHFVFASALLLLLVPAVFFRGRLTRRARAVLIGAAFVVYGVALALGQKVPGVPLIRFDGSSVTEIMRLIQSFAEPGLIRDFVARYTGPQGSRTVNLILGIPYVLLAVLGLFVPLFIGLVLSLRRKTPLLYVAFPALLLVNFLVMFFGLALDFASSTPDELSHRPLMIVYFFVVSWVGGATGFALLESRRLRGSARAAFIGLAAALFAVPAHFGPGIQQLWAMPRSSPVRLPRDLIRVAEYIRSHGDAEDVFQHSQFDRLYALAALSERRAFVSHTMTRMPFRGDVIDTRTAAIDHFMGLRNATAVRAMAHAFGFRWFVLERGDRVDWPEEIANFPVFEAGPFKVYEL
ncbi:MAG: hypothetical protein ABUL62_14500 [Myxococcales bacterium]